MTIAERLDERLDHHAPDRDYAAYEDEHGEEWRIRSMDAASWAAKKVRDARAEIAEIDAWEQRQIDAIKAAAEAERAAPKGTIEHMEGHLAAYLRHLVTEGRKTKTLNLPAGRVQLRARPARLEIEDEKTALSWLRKNAPELVRTKESVDKTKLRKAIAKDGTHVVLAETGEVVTWAHLEPQEDSLSFVPTEDVD